MSISFVKKSMKYLAICLLLFGCSIAPAEEYDSYGQAIDLNEVIQVNSFLEQVDTTAQNFKIEGIIEEVCQMKGCWLTLKNESGTTIRVTFKDYGFFVPKDIGGKNVIIEGVSKKELLDEDDAKHFAEDAGKKYDESMRSSISFEAHGVLVSKS